MNDLDEASAKEQARVELRLAQVVMTHEPAEALNHLVEAKRLDPSSLDIVLALARVEVRLARYPDAIYDLGRVLQMGPPDAEILGLLALCHRKLGHFEDAEKHSMAALSITADNHLAREIYSDCLRHGKDWKNAFRELNWLAAQSSTMGDAAVARINVKMAQCLAALGQFHEAYDITTALKDNGYSNAQVERIYQVSEDHVKAEIEESQAGMHWMKRFILRGLDRVVLLAVLEGRKRGMATLRQSHKSKLKELNDQLTVTERRADLALRNSYQDPTGVTDLPNRRCFTDDYLPKFVPGVTIGLIAFDADKFKLVNDIHGHDGGDKALRKMAQVASSIFRHPKSNAFRFGGEEFVAIVFADRMTTEAMARTLQSEMQRRAASELQDEGLTLKWPNEAGVLSPRELTVSVGVAMWPADFSKPLQVLKAADIASYVAKENGRNRVVVFRAGMAGKDGKPYSGDEDVEVQERAADGTQDQATSSAVPHAPMAKVTPRKRKTVSPGSRKRMGEMVMPTPSAKEAPALGPSPDGDLDLMDTEENDMPPEGLSKMFPGSADRILKAPNT